MSMTLTKFARAWSIPFVCIAALASAQCGSKSSPTAPSTTPEAPAATAPATATGSPAGVQILINPNPVPFSGAPITDTPSCANYAFTWLYDITLQETTGQDLTFTQRVDTFDDHVANNITGLKIVLPAKGSVTLHTRWCSGSAAAHVTQSTFNGTDSKGTAISAIAPVAHLMAGPQAKK